jgi:hypothetical protein
VNQLLRDEEPLDTLDFSAPTRDAHKPIDATASSFDGNNADAADDTVSDNEDTP